MDTYAGLVHADLSAMLRESDAFCRNMEGSMTPERIAEIFAEETGDDIDASDSALRDFARRMWNEALEHAALKINAKCTEYAQVYALPDAYDCIEVVRALKLPEE